MGVTGLWPILAPSARPTPLPALNRKRLAVDASIWIYQFLKAVRDKEGNALRNSHVVGFFRRICKLLYFGIKPVFVFDGGAPALKRQTILGRKKRREGRREDAARTAGRLLAVQMKRRGEEDEIKRRRNREREAIGLKMVEQDDGVITGDQDLVYVSEMGMSAQERERERERNRKFKKTDAYHLPELTNGIEGMGKPDDPRIMSAEELEEYARQFNNGEDVNLYDFSKIDFNGEFFMSLPAGDRYNILNAARLRSRLRMGLSKEQLEDMFPDRMAFSRFQIDRVRERNDLTQRLMNLNGMNADLAGVDGGRIAGERGREYMLVKNDGVEGGWALGVVSTDKGLGDRNKPIDVETYNQKVTEKYESEDDDEFEDIPVEGLNRLPKATLGRAQNMSYRDYQAGELENQSQQFYASPKKKLPIPAKAVSTEPDSLFIDASADLSTNLEYTSDDNRDLHEAIALSMQQDLTDEKEDSNLSKAIALSMREVHDQFLEDDEAHFEDIPIPEYKQQAALPSKPISDGGGAMIAHIVNNRASAAVSKPKPKPDAIDDSDSDIDMQSALALARKHKTTGYRTRQPLISASTTDPFDGPLPFERLDFGGSVFNKMDEGKKSEKASMDGKEAAKDHLAGGFDNDLEDENAKPVPPWLASSSDIRVQVNIQKQKDMELNAEDREMADEEEMHYRRTNEPIEITSSDNESDVEIVSPLRVSRSQAKKADGIAEDIRADTAVLNIPKYFELTFEPRINTAPASTIETVKFVNDATVHKPLQADDLFESQQAEDTEFDDFSDPDDEELLAQLAIEAEEHARFASSLNNKPERENKEAYEEELKALRSQQKKDRRDADEVSHVMVTECQALLRLFGLPYITAPMEAEAQCAELVRLGLVDGVVTDDCDIFLFGGTRVYKNMFNSNKFVECYLSNDIEKELTLTRDQLISIAHLLGSDYTEGLPGVGPVTALEIISEFPTADGLSQFKTWWAEVQANPIAKNMGENKFRKKFRRTQATKLFLPPAFPSKAVTEAYLRPVVDSTPEPFQWGVPDLDRLREFLMVTIGWSQERTDEVLVPVIRDMNRRETEGTQSNITRFFEGAVGVGVRGVIGGNGSNGNNSGASSSRMRDAVRKLKAKKGSKATSTNPLNRTFGDEAQEWAKHNDLTWTEREQEKLRRSKPLGKEGKKRVAVTTGDGNGDIGQGIVGAIDEGKDDKSKGDGGTEAIGVSGKAKVGDLGEGPAHAKRRKK